MFVGSGGGLRPELTALARSVLAVCLMLADSSLRQTQLKLVRKILTDGVTITLAKPGGLELSVRNGRLITKQNFEEKAPVFVICGRCVV